ncbi:MAG: WD40 repeat domain-containing protein [Aggregatilineales bacterium]
MRLKQLSKFPYIDEKHNHMTQFAYLKTVLVLLLVTMGGILSISLVDARSMINQELPVFRIAKSGDSRILAVIYNDFANASIIDVFDNVTGNFVQTVDISPYAPKLIDLSPTGDRLLWADSSSRVGIFDLNSQSNILITEGGPVFIEAVVWNPVNEVVGFSVNSAIDLYNAVDYSQIAVIGSPPPISAVVSFSWSYDGQNIITSHSADPTVDPSGNLVDIQLWENTLLGGIINTPSRTLSGRGGGNIEWSPDGQFIAALERGGFVVYDVVADTFTVHPFEDDSPAVLRWSPNGDLLATGGSLIRIWNTTTWEVIDTIEPEGNGSYALEWSFDGQQISHGGGPNGLYINHVEISQLPHPHPRGHGD